MRDGVERFGDRMAALALVRPKQPESLPVRIHRRRIYILPTGFGLFIAVALATMLIGGLNYNNNPALLLVFVLGAVAHNSFVHAHLILSGVRLKALHAEPVFAGQAMQLKFRFDADGARERPGLELLCGETHSVFDLGANEEKEVVLEIPAPTRGWLEVGRLRLSTLRPLGMARAWSWLRPDTRLLVYPALDTDAPDLPESLGDGDSPRTRAHGEQPHHLREYRTGDTQRQIAWKASARADRLLVREYEAAVARDITLDWTTMPPLPYEQKIRRLARWVVEAERSGSRYTLRLPGQQVPAGRGAEHRHACLRALALLPTETESRAPERPR
ncbi:DUF58 domain-containing protein [Arenimonas oryziterrae]|uniref:DUF58 domain-containing protein n=1 Tax=Arenimonas oryziterrae DSM 21050 = YC6267 TaxID=1121015 RepID=A0A091APD3_9GAMM|nr:DUF58 domain-containing protein [Arenimonas oryziterrae]KFN41246.1 hypothetical protein N789_04985 [Arenimonas oryziterrae DSM 21050 = YC6267]